MKHVLSWNSIRFRLSALLTVTVAILGLLFGAFSHYLIRKELEESLEFFAHHEAQEVALVVSNYSSPQAIEKHKTKFDALFPEKNVLALEVWSPTGERVFHLADPALSSLAPWESGMALAKLGELPYEQLTHSNRPICRAAQVIDGPNQTKWITVAIIDRSDATDTIHEHRKSFLIGLVSAVILSFFISWFLLTMALAPVQQMVRDARIIEKEGPGQRLATPKKGSELEQLSQLLNSMLGKMELSFEQLKRFTAHVGHELRTPLARMRGEAELALTIGDPEKANETIASMLEDITDLSRVIDALLELAIEEKALHQAENIDLAGLIAELSEESKVLAEEKEQTIHSKQSSKKLAVKGNRSLLARALWNLLTNAIKYAPKQSQINIQCFSLEHSVQIIVSNKFQKTQKLELDTLFEPFIRGTQGQVDTVPGYGLGLALTRSIIKRHRGQIDVQIHEEETIQFVISLPLSDV